MLEQVPIIDVPVIKPHQDPVFVKAVGRAFREIGFAAFPTFYLEGLIDRFYEESRKVFELPVSVKEEYARPDIYYQRGWTPNYHELGLACRRRGSGGKPMPDAKECWFGGPVMDPAHPLVKAWPAFYPQNIWPQEVPGFMPAFTRLYHSLYEIGRNVLRTVGNYLGYPDNFFDGMVKDSPTVMRAIHYPPVKPDEVGKIAWACEHTDINLLTVLPAPTRSGLWVRRRDLVMIPAYMPAGHVIVQVADMLDYLTGGHLASVGHEVRPPVEPTSVGRYSAALFIHARSDFRFEPDMSGPDAKAMPHLFRPQRAGDMLNQRLHEIGLALARK